MADNSIGLHIYSLHLRKKRDFKVIPYSPVGDGNFLAQALPKMIAKYSTPIDGETSRPRPWYFDSANTDGFATSGTILYGSTGFESDIVDGKTRKLRYKRSVTDLDVIPIYFRFWIPDCGELALMALQTFGQKSCVRRVQVAVSDSIKSVSEHHTLDIKPVVLSSTKRFLDGNVKSISLVKKDFSTDAADNAIVSPNDVVNMDISFKAKRRENLGKLAALKDRVRRAGGTDEDGLEYQGQIFEEATASVEVRGKTRKITLVGISENAGKIDLSDDVERLPTGHPKFGSIDQEVRTLFLDIAGG